MQRSAAQDRAGTQVHPRHSHVPEGSGGADSHKRLTFLLPEQRSFTPSKAGEQGCRLHHRHSLLCEKASRVRALVTLEIPQHRVASMSRRATMWLNINAGRPYGAISQLFQRDSAWLYRTRKAVGEAKAQDALCLHIRAPPRNRRSAALKDART